MTTEQLHEELRQCGFCKIGTGGGCDALVRTAFDTEIMLTAFEDAAVPEADDQVQITIRVGDEEISFVLSPEQTLAFARTHIVCKH